MRNIVLAIAFFLLVCFPSHASGEADAAVHAAPLSAPLLQSLRQGGYILLVRHGEASVGSDQTQINFSDCSTQRNLSEEGRRQAVSFGGAIRQLRIPVQLPVTASPFCRTRETAALAFGEQHVQIDPFWLNIYKLSGALPAAEQERIVKALTSVLEVKPPAGKNKVIVDHSFPSDVGLGEIPYMGTVLVRPLGEGKGYEVVDKISLEEFEQ
ncbi:histidine phosphatase family protein [Paenibacillus sp. sgz302251]|uniref:histidine phosphatase family protein n=1 Tax=Paenibacillus sp. sgz302251 TaxID=3414493 RepID=UPI003C7DFA51